MLMDVQKCGTKLWNNAPQNMKFTFFSALISGFLVHMFMFTNHLPNHDSLYYLDNNFFYHIQLGRWLNYFTSSLTSNSHLPWLTGVLGIVFIACSAAITSWFLNLRGSVFSILLGALFASFPSVVAISAFGNLFALFFLGLLLGSIGMVFTKRYRFGFIPGALFICLSLASFQGFFPFYAALYVAGLILDVLNQYSVKQLLTKTAQYLASLVLSLVLYFISVRISLAATGQSLMDYQGISQMGQFTLSDLPRLILGSYAGVYRYFVQNSFSAHYARFSYVFAALALFLVCLIVVVVVREILYTSPAHMVLLVLLGAAFPLAAGAIHLMSPDSLLSARMVYGYMALPVFLIAFADECGTLFPKESIGKALKTASACFGWAAAISCTLLIFRYSIFTNVAYQQLYFAYENTFAYYSRMTSTIQSTEGYTTSLPVYYIGTPSMDLQLPKGFLAEMDNMEEIDQEFVVSRKTNFFLLYYMALPNRTLHNRVKVEELPDLDVFTAEQIEEIEAMPSYPNYGGILIFDNAIVVKF